MIMANFRVVCEEFKVFGSELVDKVASFIHAGNVRRIIVKDSKGHTFLEIPLTVAAVGTIAAPVLAGLGTIAALIADFTIVVERVEEDEKPKAEAKPDDPQPQASAQA